MKDYHTFKRINSIPRESIDEIKQYLDSVGLIFSESNLPISWNPLLEKIRNDFDDFLQNGGWRFLHDDADQEGDESSEMQQDSEFEEAEDGESEDDDESDFSDDEDFDEDYSSEADDSEEEAPSWDEHERRAVEEERKLNAAR